MKCNKTELKWVKQFTVMNTLKLCLRQLKTRKTAENEEELRMKNFLLEIQIFRTE